MLSSIFSMFAGVRRRSLAMWRDRDGAVAVMMAAMLPALVAFAALAIDMSYAYWTRTQLQHAASAAALAGVQEIVDEAPADGQADNDGYRKTAIEFAYKNMREYRFGKVIQSSCGIYNPATNAIGGSAECADVKVGNWNPDARIFTAWDDTGFNPATMKLDAVRVWTRKAQMNGNPLNLFLSSAVGLAETDINTVAIAWAKGGGEDTSCYQDGMVAGGWVDIQSNNQFVNDYCIYGRDGVRVQSDSFFEDGVAVGFGPDGVLDEQGSMNLGLAEAIQPQEVIEPTKAQQIDAMISALEAGNYPNFVEFNNTGTMTDTVLPDPPPMMHTTYIIDGTATITSGANLSNLVIIADKIDVGSGVTLTDMVLVANDSDTANANISFGADYIIDNIVLAADNRIQLGSVGVMGGGLCDGNNEKTVQIMAKENVLIASDTTISNAEILAGNDVDMGSNNAINLTGDGATIQAINDIWLASDGNYGACAPTGGGEGPIVGLDFRLVG